MKYFCKATLLTQKTMHLEKKNSVFHSGYVEAPIPNPDLPVPQAPRSVANISGN